MAKKEADRITKYEEPITKVQRMWNVKAKVILANNRGDWNHLKITQTIPEQHNGKARN